jgi:glycosyltransferase involved in cell wall biosynthesis
VIVEALGAGRPVVATASTPAVEDVLGDPESGIVVPVEDVVSLRAAMRTLFDRPAPDPRRLAAIVDGYRIGTGAEAYVDSFRSVLASRREVA